MSGFIRIFEEYFPSSDEDSKTTLAGYADWFKIYVFTKKSIDVLKELQILNGLLLKHCDNKYKEFLVIVENDLPERSLVFTTKKKGGEGKI